MLQMLSTAPAQMLLASIWQGLLLTALAWGCLELAARLGVGLRASTRFTLWLVVFLLVALLPCFTVLRGLFAPGAMAAIPAMHLSLQVNAGWAFVLEGAWFIASLVSLARLWVSVRQMRRLLRESTPIPFSSLGPELQSLVTQPGSRPLEIRLCNTADAPSVIGFFHPAVVVPASLWAELADSDRQAIILHEKAHLDRGDDWTNLLQKLLRALCPLNPALAWAEGRLCREREQACDDAVLQAAGDARAYATCLTRLAESRLVKRAAALAPGLWRRHSELAVRVEHILHPRRTLGALFSRGLVSACMVLAFSTALLLQRCPELIVFGSTPPIAAKTTPSMANNLVPVKYSEHAQARYQDAVLRSPVKKAKAHRGRSAYAITRVQYLQVRSGGDGVTVVLFTVEMPGDARLASYPFLFPDNWIDSQI